MDAVLERIYAIPPPHRPRTRPLKLICVGPSRSGTDSLRQALLQLGYPKVFHGFETMLENNRHQKPLISQFLNKKYHDRSKYGDISFTARDFDKLFGEYDALTDMPVASLAAELIAAYPDVKVILNRRSDLDIWYTSTLATFAVFENSWLNWLRSFFSPDLYWTQRLIFREMMPWFYRGSFRANGKWVYREHCAMIRGLVPKEQLLEWTVEDGWDPLCEFLGKEVPKTEFPKGNAPPEFAKKIGKAHAKFRRDAYWNMVICGTALAGVAGVAIVWRR